MGTEEYIKYSVDTDNRSALEKAEGLYHKALLYDSTFAKAYVGLAIVYWEKHYWHEFFKENFMDSVLAMTNIAISLDNQLSQAYTVRGNYYSLTGNPEKALEEFDRAIKINPNDWMAYKSKGDLYGGDDMLKSIENFQIASALNRGPQLPGLLKSLAWAYFNAGFIDKQYYYDKEALKLDGDSVSYYGQLSVSEYWSGNYKKSLELALKAFKIDSTSYMNLVSYNYYMLGQNKESLKYAQIYVEQLKKNGIISIQGAHRIGYAYWLNGYNDEATYYFDKQLEYCFGMIKSDRPTAQKKVVYYDIAAVYAFKGDKGKAYKNLRIFNERPRMTFWMAGLIRHDPLFDSVRNEPEFQAIVSDVETKYQREHERVRKWVEEHRML
jgi:tetratricopeptide (TPR) repeat protein